MAIDFKKGALALDPDLGSLGKEAAELGRMGGTRECKAQYLLSRHDRASRLTGRRPEGREIDEIQDRILRDMGRISEERRKLEDRASMAGPGSPFTREDWTGLAESRYKAATEGDGPSAPGTDLKDMPLFEAVHIYDGRYPGVIRRETLDCLPGYGRYAERAAGRAPTGRDVPERLSGIAGGGEDGLEKE